MDMKKILFYITCLLAVSAVSCSDETIDSKPGEFFETPDLIYTNKLRTQQFINNIYLFVPRGYNRLDANAAQNDVLHVTNSRPDVPAPVALTAMVASATDEAVHTTRGSAAEKWGTGQWGVNSNNTWDSPYKLMYIGIRRTFEYTEDIDPNIPIGTGNQLTAAERSQYLGEVIFLRALFNFELLKRFGGYPLVKSKLSIDDNFNIPKSSYDECVQYITSLCDEAAAVLPATRAAAELGRATKGAALALKGRLLLYAASPLNNPGNDLTKWQAAAAANDTVRKLNVYSLNTTAGYEASFYTLAGNNEIILSKMETNSNIYERINGLPSLTGGFGGTNPTWDLVKDYEMLNGTPYDFTNPTHAANPFDNRDPRLAKTVLYNGAAWMLTTVQTVEGQKDKDPSNAYSTRTGFYLRKFLNTNARFSGANVVTFHCFPLFRYAETLLNYAEAMNEAYGPDLDPRAFGMTARQAITLIRTRAGLTGNQSVPSAVTQAQMRTAIRHERRIELAFEEHRHMDLRRWKTAETVLNQPVYGLKIVQNGSTLSYVPEIVEQRKFDASKMYLYPFPQQELSRNTSLVQNPNW